MSTTNQSLNEQLMEQAQVFASAWAMIDGPFDSGDQLERAEDEKAALSDMIDQALGHIAEERDQLIKAFEVLNKWHAKRVGELKLIEDAAIEGMKINFGQGDQVDMTLTKESALGLKLGVLTAIQLLGALPVQVKRNEPEDEPPVGIDSEGGSHD